MGPNNMFHRIGRRVRAARKRVCLTAAQVAREAGVSKRVYQCMEAGDLPVDIPTITTVSDITGKSIDFLIRGREFEA